MPKGHQESILISSPDAQVYYHADLPGQSLVQIAGRKRVYVYPNTAPFITPEHLEDIALFNVEVDLPYKDWYDDHAKVLDIGPGQMLSWQMNAPHRVENLDTFSVSMTISYTNEEIRRAEIVNLANGLLRHRFGYTPKSRNLRGPSYFAKAVHAEAAARQQMGQARAQRAPSDRLPPRRRAARQDRRSAEGGVRQSRDDGIDGRATAKPARAGDRPRGRISASSWCATGNRRRRAGTMSARRRRSSIRNGLTHGTAPLPASIMSSR